jgi:hypothetical protein
MTNNAGAPFAVAASHGPVDTLLSGLHASRGGLTAEEARRRLGFVALPGAYFVFLGGVTMTYLVLVELVKRRLMRTLLGTNPAAPATGSVTPAP